MLKTTMSESEDHVKLMVHHVRFFEFQPQTINCIAHDSTADRVAVSRADGSVEVLSLQDNWIQEMTISGGQGASVETLIWCHGRLFAGGIGGNIVELDMNTRKPKASVSSNAGPIWCLAKNSRGNKVAAGTEDGCVVLFDVSEELQFLRGFAKQEGRILSLAWYDQDGESIIISGSINNIRQWSVKSGQPISRMTLGRKFEQETIVWCLTVTRDFTIISGDSRGVITFWNGREATQLKTFNCHKADVLSLCLSEDETEVFSGGVDASLFQFSLCSSDPVTERRRWVHQPLHWRHTHDVRALAYTRGYLVSGGVDTNLFVAKLKGHKRVLHVAPIPKHGLINIAKERNLVQLQYDTHIEVWRLGAANTPFAEERGMLPLTQKRQKLVVLKAREECGIICSNISASGSILGYSDNKGIRVFTLTLTESESSAPPQVSLQRVTTVAPHTPPAYLMTFTPSGSHLVAVLTSGDIFVTDLASGDTNQVEHTRTDNPVHRLCVSHDGKMFAVAGLNHSVQVYSVATCQPFCSCPELKSQVAALAFSPHSSTLVIAYCDHSIYEFDLDRKEFTPWSRENSGRFPNSWMKPLRHIIGIAFFPDAPDKILVHTDSACSVIDKSKELAQSDKKKFQTMESVARTCHKYKYLLFADFLSNGMLVAVERPPSQIEDNLPPSFKQKKFGVS